ncbi:hypothetical protein THAOC_02114 [Thalassiosira oceanica]|uniref:Uncharacterized protein n=1 Tax=Thalassiosira oceanica TaxID=159749 RepID=K0TFK2_THAOC|nr:hypothetical protein THAOC_02114 [Thalassiosira oceanica]|eukprot:EJK76140.1 hypothetical protein THAOC_02114 [Thalassiosira oceanica]
MEEFHLRRREAYGPNPRIPAVGALVSGSFVRHQAAEIRRRKSVGSAWRARIGGFFFLTALLAVTSYHTNKTLLVEAPFGPFGDDNGPGLEPPPRNRIGIATAFMPSRRRSPTAPGKPSFPYFKADYLP